MAQFVIDERLDELEEKLKEKNLKNEKVYPTTAAQKILLLHHLGLLEVIGSNSISQVKQAKLLSLLLNASDENIRHHLSQINLPDSELKTISNYEFLIKTFEDNGLDKMAQSCEEILKTIQNKKDKKKTK